MYPHSQKLQSFGTHYIRASTLTRSREKNPRVNECGLGKQTIFIVCRQRVEVVMCSGEQHILLQPATDLTNCALCVGINTALPNLQCTVSNIHLQRVRLLQDILQPAASKSQKRSGRRGLFFFSSPLGTSAQFCHLPISGISLSRCQCQRSVSASNCEC